MRRPCRSILAAAAVLALTATAVACGDDSDDTTSATMTAETTIDPEAADAPATLPAANGDIVVLAAASLTAAFEVIGSAFTAANPDTDLTFNFGASSELVTQIGEGAPADVFASADLNNMTKLTDAGNNATEPVRFATNLLEIVVEPDNPEAITGVESLANDDLIVVTCALEVPCGKYAAEIFENAGVTVTPDSLEENVKAVVTKVTAGEADAGIVYVTDVTAAGDAAAGVEIPEDINVVAEYPIAVTGAAANPEGAQAFIDFVLSDEGQAILASYGFLPK